MVMPNVDYITVSTGGDAYAFPVKPVVPNYTGETATARDALKDEYKEEMDQYTEAKALQKHLKALMIAAMLAHIMKEYGVITPKGTNPGSVHQWHQLPPVRQRWERTHLRLSIRPGPPHCLSQERSSR
jgi:hypothetical protein